MEKLIEAAPKLLTAGAASNQSLIALALIGLFSIAAAYVYFHRPVATTTGEIRTTGQRGGINSTGALTINQEDKSPKRRMRDLLNAVDQRILYEVS